MNKARVERKKYSELKFLDPMVLETNIPRKFALEANVFLNKMFFLTKAIFGTQMILEKIGP